MPAFTNSRFGSSRMSDALGTTVWSLPSKYAMKRRLISAVSIGWLLECGRAVGRRARRSFDHRGYGGRQRGAGGALAELRLTLAHPGRHVRGESPEPDREGGGPRRD